MRNGFLRTSKILQCDAGVERDLRIAGLELQSFRVALPGIVETAQFQLQITPGREDFGRPAAALYGYVQIAQRALGLACQVMGNGPSERTRYVVCGLHLFTIRGGPTDFFSYHLVLLLPAGNLHRSAVSLNQSAELR